MISAYLRAGLLAAGMLLAGCDNPRAASAASAGGSPEPAGSGAASAAGDDFYLSVNGEWIDGYQLPPDRSEHGVVGELTEQAEQDVRAIVEELAASNPTPGSLAAKVGDLYASLMDEDAIEAQGITPLKPFLERIASIRTSRDLVDAWGTIGYAAPINVGVAPHPDHPDETALWLRQDGLGMPHRGYYLDIGLKAEQLRRAYRTHVQEVMALLGHADAEGAAKRIYALERRIAEAHTWDDRSLSMGELYQATDVAGLNRFAPGFDWTLFLERAGYAKATTIIITDGTAVRDCVALLGKIPLQDWKDWMAFHIADSFSVALPRAFRDSSFEFESHALQGVEKQPQRWRVSINILLSFLGDGLGELYVKRHFSAEEKQQVEEMVANVRAAFARRLDGLEWMDAATRAEAHAKLDALQAMVGYPSVWQDYSGLKIERGKLVESLYGGFQYMAAEEAAKLGKPADRQEWPVPPQVVNAFYNPLANNLSLPAGILRPPFFDPKGDAAENYGAIGAIIGHEISHGFDDHGRQLDGTGARRNWWTEETNERFLEASEALTAQYDGFCASLGVCVNGMATLGENIGDLAGLELAYDAWQASLGGKPALVSGGLTGEQRFFTAYARSWREKVRDEVFEAQMTSSDHAPSRYRVNGVVRNMDEWYAAFDVRKDAKLYLAPQDRVKIW